MIPVQISKCLQRRLEWRTLGPCLTSSAICSFQENEASIFDLECQFVRKAGPCTICILLLWASDDPALNLDRLQSDLPVKKNAADMGVVMLVQSGTQSAGGLQVVQQFLALQAGLLNAQTTPVLLSPTVEGILPTLEEYIREIEKAHQIRTQTPSPSTTTLMAHATFTAPVQPLSRHAADTLGSLFPTIRLLEEATRTSDGRKMIAEYLGPVATRNVVEFWENEYIV